MNNNRLKKCLCKTGNYLNKNAASILTGMSMVGVATTAVMGIKATPKALKVLNEKEEYKLENYNEPLTFMEKAITLTPVYLPTILMGAATMSCIYGANHINKKQQAVLTGAYTYLNSCYNDYRDKVKELYGEDADAKVKNEIAKDKYLEQDVVKLPLDNKLYYDEFSGRYFNLNPSDFPQIVHDINKMYNLSGEMTLNNVYEYLGLEGTDFGATVGWSAVRDWECNGFSWIDILVEPMDMPDNLECYAIKFNIDPSKDYIQWTW